MSHDPLSSEITQTLRGVSRSLYLSFRILPPAIRTPLSLGYLLCRAADTLADTALLPSAQRLKSLELFRSIFEDKTPPSSAIPPILEQTLPSLDHPSERKLLLQLPILIPIWQGLPPQKKERIREVVLGVTEGMTMDLSRFPSNSQPHALSSPDQLQQYCYFIGGVPGIFWTRIFLENLPGLSALPAPELIENGKRFGMSLQMMNILRDLSSDLKRGRCYLPETELRGQGMAALDLRNPEALDRLGPILKKWMLWTLEGLDRGFHYVQTLPKNEYRLKASVLWPLRIALKTLRSMAQSHQPFASEGPGVPAPFKIARRQVYQTLLATPFYLAFPLLLRLTHRRLRTQIMESIQTPLPQSPPYPPRESPGA
ncbi:MAG: squalene/phytoene synthase family protein [Elusimicrobia bacterium]|nr:squalene/phytoene synthase family protein [Elusimicrobiota bacterium]